jgi:L-rhamnose-H+ transport protein
MTPQPLLGLVFHAIGGAAAASFYVPLKFIRRWPWESFYLAMGVFAWLCTPWIFAGLTTPDLRGVLVGAPVSALAWTFTFGVLWGVGAVTYGLTMRYLGMALGMSVSLGFCALFGTLLPPLVKGQLAAIAASQGGQVVLAGVLLCVVGILVSGYAGVRKDRERSAALPADGKTGDTEFAPGKGLLVAFVCGIMSACFAFGIQSGAPIAARALAAGVNPLFQNNVVLCVILAGGFLTNTLWCLYLNARNHTFHSYASATGPQTLQVLGLCALAGVIWYCQFFFYGMGMSRMGAYDFSSWSLHMAFIIICGGLWGLGFKEWRGTSAGTRATVWAGLLLLILSTVIIGWGNAMARPPTS